MTLEQLEVAIYCDGKEINVMRGSVKRTGGSKYEEEFVFETNENPELLKIGQKILIWIKGKEIIGDLFVQKFSTNFELLKTEVKAAYIYNP